MIPSHLEDSIEQCADIPQTDDEQNNTPFSWEPVASTSHTITATQNINPTLELSPYEHLISATELPPPGPSHYAARRALWLAPTSQQKPTPPSSSRKKLEHILSQEGAVQSDEVWRGGLRNVWKTLSGGGRLKRPLPMNLVIQIVHAGWLRDPDTWPIGAVAQDSEPEQEAISTSTPTEPDKPLGRLVAGQLQARQKAFDDVNGIVQASPAGLVVAGGL